MLSYGAGLSIPLIIISSIGGAIGNRIKEYSQVSGDVADRVIGIAIVIIGVYFLYLAFV